MEFYGFVHFTVNTFTDKEWGYGDESPSVFNPTALDTRQWVHVARDAGMKGLILTCKHHDGFCLWSSRYTEHSVKHAPWKNGRGDLVRELSDACREQGVKFGVYLSPWDRNHPEYGRPAYITYFRNQLRELLTQYGPVFGIWFDGANGGDGYYGGARETRQIDRTTYYDWDTTRQLVRDLQPEAVMFSDVGPDIRWVGNENGIAAETTWLTLSPTGWAPGQVANAIHELAQGHEHGAYWMPPEADVSIRPGWFYHASEDPLVKSAAQLVELYYQSIGRSATFLLNLPPDRRGLIHKIDAEHMRLFRRILDETFKTNLARGAQAAASNTRSHASRFAAANVCDGRSDTYWATDDNTTTGWVELDLGRPQPFDRVVMQEYIALGQRVQAWTIEAEVDGQWLQIGAGTTIGYKRILRCQPVAARRVRLSIVKAKACPTIATLALYLAPLVAQDTDIPRDRNGTVSMKEEVFAKSS